MGINVVEIIYGWLQLYLWRKFPQISTNKIVEFAGNLLGRQVQVQLLEDQKSHKINFIAVVQIVSYDLHGIDIFCSLSGRESCYFEEILNPLKICLRKDFNFSHVCN